MFFMHDSPHPVKHKITVETVRKPQVLCNEIRNFVSRVTETYAHAWCTSPLQSCRKVQNVAGNMTDRRQKLYSKTSQYAPFFSLLVPWKPSSVPDPGDSDRFAGTCSSETRDVALMLVSETNVLWCVLIHNRHLLWLFTARCYA